MKVRNSVGVVIVLTAMFVIWPQWTTTVPACVLDEDCLPLRAHVMDPLTDGGPIMVNPGDIVSITCSIDCRGMNLTGCKVIEDWTVMAISPSGEYNDNNAIRIYDGLRQTPMRFAADTGVSVIFGRNNVTDSQLNQPEICNGRFTNEHMHIYVNFTAVSDVPKFRNFVFFCGLGRLGSIGFTPRLKVYDISSRDSVSIYFNFSETCTDATPSTSQPTSPPITSTGLESSPTAISATPRPSPTAAPMIVGLSTSLGVVVLVAVLAITGLVIMSYAYCKERKNRVVTF